MGAELRGVDKAYGARTVLRGLDAAFAPGRLTALSGRSGSGKSTVLRLLAGLERPDAGAVLLGDERIDDRDRSALAALRREHVAIVAQDVGLVGFLGAQENVELALAQRGVPERDARARAAVAELLAEAAARHGVTIVCATHDPLVVARADDRIAL
ncbi:MAG: ATP-binding cassette domain-containing protein [Solirubrobacteraceae bacterium]|nr:ATP-binding cassette domain-containing protein [Solirubrobacteraceae bacterium]